MQRSAQRAEGDRAAVPGRMGAVSNPGTEIQKRARLRQRRLSLLRLGGSLRYSGARQKHADHYRQFVRFTDRSGEREINDTARALSDGLLCQRDGRTLRRSQGRMERKGSVDDLG